jgi:hypothetical protein
MWIAHVTRDVTNCECRFVIYMYIYRVELLRIGFGGKSSDSESRSVTKFLAKENE